MKGKTKKKKKNTIDLYLLYIAKNISVIEFISYV